MSYNIICITRNEENAKGLWNKKVRDISYESLFLPVFFLRFTLKVPKVWLAVNILFICGFDWKLKPKANSIMTVQAVSKGYSV